LSPVRFNNSSIRTLVGVNHLFNSETSEVSASNPALKKLQLHTYHIRDKNGSPTAQVAILRDFQDDQLTQLLDLHLGEAPNAETTSQSTTKFSGPKKNKKSPRGLVLQKAQSILISQGPEEEQCKGFNADIMRTLVARKMAKQKTFYEMKVAQ